MPEERRPAQDEKPAKESGERISVFQVAAATGAATTGAIVTNMLGLFGTVTGVALLSVISSTSTVWYLRSMNTTKDKVEQIVKRPDGETLPSRLVPRTLRAAAPTSTDAEKPPATAPMPRVGTVYSARATAKTTQFADPNATAARTQPLDPDETIALGGTDETVALNQPSDSDKTVALGGTDETVALNQPSDSDKTVALDGTDETVALNQPSDSDETVALDGTDETVALNQPSDADVDPDSEPDADATDDAKSAPWWVRWRTVALTSALVFGLSIAALTAVGLLTGQSADHFYSPPDDSTTPQEQPTDEAPATHHPGDEDGWHDSDDHRPTGEPSEGHDDQPDDEEPSGPGEQPPPDDDDDEPTDDPPDDPSEG